VQRGEWRDDARERWEDVLIKEDADVGREGRLSGGTSLDVLDCRARGVLWSFDDKSSRDGGTGGVVTGMPGLKSAEEARRARGGGGEDPVEEEGPLSAGPG
jgi:hypothetical protein